jgi:hypothetical protein
MSSSQNVTLILYPAHLMTKRSHMSEKKLYNAEWKHLRVFSEHLVIVADHGNYLATSHFILSEKSSISGSKGAQKASSQSKGMSNTKTSVKMFRPEVN